MDTCRTRRILVGLTLASLAGALSVGSAAEVDVKATLTKALKLCTELTLPNSMARPPGFDINAHLRQVEAEYQVVSAQLATPAGISAIENFLVDNPDELDTICAVETAGRTKREEAKPILDRFRASRIPGLSEIADRYLAKQR